MHDSTFIVVWEGLDGAGKTTLLNRTLTSLTSMNYKALTYKTPSDTPSGIFARKYGNRSEIDHMTRMLLFLANTSDDSSIMKREIESEKPNFYFIDRYYLCSIVYGLALSKARGEEVGEQEFKKLIELIEKIGFTVFLRPDLYVIVDVEEEERRRRLEMKESQGGIEDEIEKNIEIQKQVRRFYRVFYELRPQQTIWIVNAEGQLEHNTEIIVDRLLELAKLKE
ncbi:MAG: dTMP kinase [Nitrososphaerota archaeon]